MLGWDVGAPQKIQEDWDLIEANWFQKENEASCSNLQCDRNILGLIYLYLINTIIYFIYLHRNTETIRRLKKKQYYTKVLEQ